MRAGRFPVVGGSFLFRIPPITPGGPITVIAVVTVVDNSFSRRELSTQCDYYFYTNQSTSMYTHLPYVRYTLYSTRVLESLL